MKKFMCTTLGCKVNRYETEALAEKLEDRGWRRASEGTPADLCIINTCTVTVKAAMQSRQAVRKAIRLHPEAVVAVTGCYAQIAPHILSDIPGVDWVVDNGNKHRLLEYLNQSKHDGAIAIVDDVMSPRPFQDLPLTRFGARTRAFVKIQDGCDAFCSYCIIPFTRGRSRSLAPDAVIERMEALSQKGYLEMVLCGIHVGRYGQDLTPATSLAQLLARIENLEGVKRLRISSIEPLELTEEIVQQMAESRQICPHLHIPLQSGSDDILKAMNRPYDTRFYRDLMHRLVHTIPHLSIGVDVMAGFPGETDSSFENTYRFIENLPVAYLHVFPFSLHQKTAAAKLDHHIPTATVKERCRQLRQLGNEKRKRFHHRFVGTVQEVLVEGKRDPSGYLKGFTGNYIPVFLEGDDSLYHHIVPVVLEKSEKGRIIGRLSS